MPHKDVQRLEIAAVELEHRNSREGRQQARHESRGNGIHYPADARVAVFSIDAYGDLTAAATSASVGVSSFNGVAISQ